MKDKTILCVGGDSRMTYTAKALSKRFRVFTYGITDDGQSTTVLPSLDAMSEKADMLILGIIRSKGLEVSVFRDKNVSCEKISPLLKEGAIVIGGTINPCMTEYFSSMGFSVCDYMKREELVLRNTIPTAEGALEIALRELAITVRDSRCLIVGSGRVAASCAELFSAVGAVTDIAARNKNALAAFELRGLGAFELRQLGGRIGRYDLIINTVPALILDKDILALCSKKCLIIDLASKPGGIDFEEGKRLGLRCIHALGLPGKCAPVTAGEMIAKTAVSILNESEE
ncbi:MAG: serine carboxypeptidase [Ruminococcus sp.]|nr:serine carboxypeptidase [Ruminococcus sp.]